MKNTDFKFLVINTKAKWEEGAKNYLDVSDAGIALKKEPSHVIEREIGKSAGWIKAADIAVDACGVLYIVDGSRIIPYDPVTKRTERLNCIGGAGTLTGQFSSPRGIALSPDTLYVADTGNNRIQAFARINWQIRWIREVAAPSDITIDTQGNLYVLEQEKHRILKFDKGGKLDEEMCVETGLEEPLNIAVDKDCFLYVLLDTKKIQKFGTERKNNLVEPEFDLEELGIEPSGLAVDLEGNVYVGDKRAIKGGEEERFIHKFNPEGDYIGPLWGYRGPCYGMVMDEQGKIYVITGAEGELAFLNYITERYFIKEPGSFISKALDSNELNEPERRWHKIVLDAEIPDKTQINAYYYSSDVEKRQEDILAFSESEWTELASFRTSELKKRDALIQGPSGRFLWLRLVLISSDEYKTPKIKSIRAYFPRSSYLRYLPAVYQEDEKSRDFLERFLSLFETFLGCKEEEIAEIARYFDVKAAPGEFISWLATWVAAIFDESWTEEKRRIFLQRAVALYKKRGTREGLEDLIEIYTGNKPIIVENFQLRCTDNEDIRATLEKLFGISSGSTRPYRFCVLLEPVEFEDQLKTVKRIVELEKPAHTNAGVVVLQPWIHLDMHTYLSINTYLSKPVMQLGITAVIGRDRILTDIEGAGQIERRSRTGIDTVVR
jgi:phage tail-like protein